MKQWDGGFRVSVYHLEIPHLSCPESYKPASQNIIVQTKNYWRRHQMKIEVKEEKSGGKSIFWDPRWGVGSWRKKKHPGSTVPHLRTSPETGYSLVYALLWLLIYYFKGFTSSFFGSRLDRCVWASFYAWKSNDLSRVSKNSKIYK
jgi:hypothetical protein